MFDFVPGNLADLSSDFINLLVLLDFLYIYREWWLSFFLILYLLLLFHALVHRERHQYDVERRWRAGIFAWLPVPEEKFNIMLLSLKHLIGFIIHAFIFKIWGCFYLCSYCFCLFSCKGTLFLGCLLILKVSCSIALGNSLGASQKPGRCWAWEKKLACALGQTLPEDTASLEPLHSKFKIGGF